jgi:hypothetical protein
MVYIEDISNQLMPLTHSFIDEDPRSIIRIGRIDDRWFAVVIDGETIDGVQQGIDHALDQFILTRNNDEPDHCIDRVTFVQYVWIVQRYGTNEKNEFRAPLVRETAHDDLPISQRSSREDLIIASDLFELEEFVGRGNDVESFDETRESRA